MKTPDPMDQLLEDVLASNTRDTWRDASLRAGLAALHRHRRRRAFLRTSAVIALPLLMLGLFWVLKFDAAFTSNPPLRSAQPQPPEVERFIPGTDIRLITDEELFALFPGRPLALIGPKGAQELVLLDELRHEPHAASN